MKTLILLLISTICLGQNSISKKAYDSIYYQSDSLGDLYLPPFDTGKWVLWNGKEYEYVNDGSVKLHAEVYSELRKMWVTIFVSFGITYAFIALILYNYKKK